MNIDLATFQRIFSSTQTAIEEFMLMLEPVIANAENEHERLYHHHIYEEEEQRLEHLAELLPLIEQCQKEGSSLTVLSSKFQRLLQELHLARFGLHNFVEHIDLALFQFTDEERTAVLNMMREEAHNDYQKVKELLADMNRLVEENAATPSPVQHIPNIRSFTVGSLKN